MKRRVPKLKSDAAAEAWLQRDHTDLDYSQFKPVRFEFAAKDARVNMRLPEPLLRAVKAKAARERMPYQRFIRIALERAVAGSRR